MVKNYIKRRCLSSRRVASRRVAHVGDATQTITQCYLSHVWKNINVSDNGSSDKCINARMGKNYAIHRCMQTCVVIGV